MESKLSVTTAPRNLSLLHQKNHSERAGIVYGIPVDPYSILKIVGLQDEAKEEGAEVIMVESGMDAFNQLLEKNAPWITRNEMKLHMKWSYDVSSLPYICVLGIMYQKEMVGSPTFQDLLFLELIYFEESLNPSSFKRYLESGDTKERVREAFGNLGDSTPDLPFTEFGKKLFLTLRYDLCSLDDFLSSQKMDVRDLWDYYFSDLSVEDLLLLTELKNFLEDLGETYDVNFGNLDIIGTYVLVE